MADFLTTVKTTKKVQSNIEKFESLTLDETRSRANSTKGIKKPIIGLDSEIEPPPLLTATSTKPVLKAGEITSDLSTTDKPTAHRRHDSAVFVQKSYLKHPSPNSLADDAREILKSQPTLEDVEAVLAYIQYGIDGQHDFNIKITSPKAALLVRTLTTVTIPDLWPSLKEDDLSETDLRMRKTLLESMFSVTGIEALLGHVQMLSRQSRSNAGMVATCLDFLSALLRGSRMVMKLLKDATALYAKDVQRRLFWQSVVSLLAGSKVLSMMASLPTVTNQDSNWLVNGATYTKWLAGNIVTAATELPPNDTLCWTNLEQLFKRGLSLGYKDVFVVHIYTSLLFGQRALWTPLHRLIKGLPSYDQKLFLDCILEDLSHTYLREVRVGTDDPDTPKVIAGAAGLINGLTSNNEYLLECVIDWVSTSSGNQAIRGSGVRRALIVLLAQSNSNLERVLERTLISFSDKLQIQHLSTAQQEHSAQTILLIIGYLSRQNPASLKQMPIPSLVMNAVSNRLASSIPRTRLLGMIVGVAVSQCVDEPGRVMNFKVEEMETEEVKHMFALTKTHDRIGSIEDLKALEQLTKQQTRPSKKRKIAAPKQSRKAEPALTSKITSIEEVSASSDEDDLVPYQKPADDPEDSDEDPTLINRDKPKAPVYIVDLIKQLQLPSDKLDIISLALKTAPSLIRRKAGFGTELSDKIHGLSSALVNLQDGMSKPEHQQQRLDALIACMAAQPKEMGKFLTNTYFSGDFSLTQRSTLLTAIGLGAREIAGFTDDTAMQSDVPGFPSQRLPPHLQPNPLAASNGAKWKQLTTNTNPVSLLTNAATTDTIRPLALAAAESQSGPSFLQVTKTTRTSSRLTKSQKQSDPSSRTRRIPKDIHDVLTNSIYLPLASPLSAILAYISMHPSSSGSASLILHPSVLSLHIQTLTLLLHTLGPIGLSTPAIYFSVTHETMLLVTHLSRSPLALDGVILPALLGLLLALIDLTVEIGVVAMERLIGAEFDGQVAELVRWVANLEGRNDVPPPSDGDDKETRGMRWTVLAAGIQVRWVEIVKRFQSRMLGLGDDGF